MAGVIEYLVLSIVLMYCDCSPIKRSTDQPDTVCNGTDCYSTSEIVSPENLTDVVLVNLPFISHTQAEIVSILNNQTISVSAHIANQDRIVTLLTRLEASLDSRTETQNQMVSLLSKQTVTLDRIANLLNNQSVNEEKILSVLDKQLINFNTQTARQDDIASLLDNITESLETMIAKYDQMEKVLVDNDHLANLTTPMPNGEMNLSTLSNQLVSLTTHAPNEEMNPNQQQENMTTKMADVFTDCTGIASQMDQSKPYKITPHGASRSYTVRCDLETDGGGWTVIQRRFDGSVDFYRDWQDYVDGFGDPNGEYWAGLELIHILTTTGMWELRVDLEDFDDDTAFAHYVSFKVGDATSNYRLSLGTYDGTAENSMTFDNNKQFSTRDNDNDASAKHCSERNKGAWWYSDCSLANLNGKYLGPNKVDSEGLTWFEWKHRDEVLKKSEMKIRRI